MSNRNDPTANQAIGNLTKEWNRLSKLADRIRKDPWSDWSMAQRRQFTGIFRRLLDDPSELARPKAS